MGLKAGPRPNEHGSNPTEKTRTEEFCVEANMLLGAHELVLWNSDENCVLF